MKKLIAMACVLCSLVFTAQAEEPAIYDRDDQREGLSTFPKMARADHKVYALLPMIGCYHGVSFGKEDHRSIDFKRRGNEIRIIFSQRSWGCFSAGDPQMMWRIAYPLGQLDEGQYTIHYTLRQRFSSDEIMITKFSVGKAKAIPTSNHKAHFFLAVLVICAVSLKFVRWRY